MEKTIEIDGKQVRLKITGATPKRYKAQFLTDYFADLLKLSALQKFDLEKGVDDIDPKAFELVDFEVFYNFVWVMAKTADPEIADPLTWLDSFDDFPILDILGETQDLMIRSIQSKKK